MGHEQNYMLFAFSNFTLKKKETNNVNDNFGFCKQCYELNSA